MPGKPFVCSWDEHLVETMTGESEGLLPTPWTLGELFQQHNVNTTFLVSTYSDLGPWQIVYYSAGLSYS